MTHADIFSGIGGFSLAASWLGWDNIFQCEIDPFCQRVLKHHFPNTDLYGDIKTTDFTKYRGAVDVISGGFPCQDISIAGKQKGLKGERSGLFYEYIRAVDEIRPRYSIWENVREVRKYMPDIIQAYSEIGYCLQWTTVCASWFGFPHERKRIYGIAYNADSIGWNEIQLQAGIIEKEIYEASKREFSRATCRTIQFEYYAEFLRMDDGISEELGSSAIKALGNAIVSAIAYNIFKAIEETNKI